MCGAQIMAENPHVICQKTGLVIFALGCDAFVWRDEALSHAAADCPNPVCAEKVRVMQYMAFRYFGSQRMQRL
jgi:hypothetical protein